jgi:very-short-patch-repair endonuclease
VLEAAVYRVVRFWNHEVLGNTMGVLELVLRELTPSTALPQGGGRQI